MALSNSVIADSLDRLIKVVTPTIPEVDFVRFFLPIFAATPTDQAVNVNTWLDVCGSPYVSVNVVDEKAKVLFQVPPLLNASDKLLGGLSGISVYETLATAQLKYNVLPKLGEMHIRQWLTERLGNQLLGIEAARQWNAIFSRYNLPLIPLPNAPGQVGTEAGSSSTVSFDDYEEL